MKRFTVVALLAFSCALAACKGTRSEPPPPPTTIAPLPAAEVKRSVDACNDYVSTICACADAAKAAGSENAATLGQDCDLAKAMPDALELNLSMQGGSGVSPRDQLQIQQAAKQIAASCITQRAALPQRGCK